MTDPIIEKQAEQFVKDLFLRKGWIKDLSIYRIPAIKEEYNNFSCQFCGSSKVSYAHWIKGIKIPMRIVCKSCKKK